MSPALRDLATEVDGWAGGSGASVEALSRPDTEPLDEANGFSDRHVELVLVVVERESTSCSRSEELPVKMERSGESSGSRSTGLISAPLVVRLLRNSATENRI